MANTYSDFVQARLAAGDNPRDIEYGIREVLLDVQDWALWGDGRWRPDYVCATCGWSYVNLCGHAALGLPAILRSKWERKKASHANP